MSAVSATGVWEVGNANFGQTLILRWNGRTWTQVPSPSPNPDSSGVDNLAGVSALSLRHALAVGYSDDAFTGVNLSLIAGWNGRRWSRQ